MTGAIDLTLDIRVEAEDWNTLEDLDGLARKAALTVLEAVGITGEVEISLLATDDTEMALLNAEFREKPKPTNVLSWPTEDLAPEVPGTKPAPPNFPELGDIAIGFGICRAEADAANVPFHQHITHLLMHGTLHLLGFDHEKEADAVLMEGIEQESLAKLGYHNPYS